MKDIIFLKPVYKLSEVPTEELPEVILCGRSNVGKSSFINTLFNKKNLAKTSSTPGKTRSINYYLVDNNFFMIDLPGFGYAKVSKSERDSWKKMVNNFFERKVDKRIAIHLIDSRHKPMEPDFELNEYLIHNDIPYIIILNKIDKLKQSELSAAKKNIKEFFPNLSYGDNLFHFSSVTGVGKKEIINMLSRLFN
jgi:GTP-binding protein